jgi:arabinose-5-phosphate isomerase
MILETAIATIHIEIQALVALKENLGVSFIAAIETIYKNNGRVVVTGIGKSAIVAQKIVATLNSTGTPALFMHAADAIHGDLGMIQAQDIVLCLSKSGDTPEIKVLVPLLKNFGNPLIAMVSNADSYLGKNADYILLTPIEKEADPNNLAPTASTTAQMALGDAMAIALLKLRGFTSNDFAQFHPGGALGKQLYLRVQDIYTINQQPSVRPDDNLQKIILEMTSKRLGATAVVDEHHQLLGMITDGDLRRMLEKKEHFNFIQANDIMNSRPKTIEKETLAVLALEQMRQANITQLVVVEKNTYLGMIHLHDLLREGLV